MSVNAMVPDASLANDIEALDRTRRPDKRLTKCLLSEKSVKAALLHMLYDSNLGLCDYFRNKLQKGCL